MAKRLFLAINPGKKVKKELKKETEEQFLPHITLGRIKKVLGPKGDWQ